MGFRTTLISEDTGLFLTDEFLEKYPYVVCNKNSEGENKLAIAILREIKFYSLFKETELFIDIQNLMKEQNFESEIPIILLHECGGITRIEITQDNILGAEPKEWKLVEGVGHDYCYGCSQINQIN